MVKILIMTIQVNFCAASPELPLLKFLPLTYHHSHFLAATLDLVKILIMAIQVNFCAASPKLPLLKFLPLTYHHSHFLDTTLDFTSFFTIAFLRATHFLQLGCFGLDFISFCICIPQSWPMAGFGTFLTYLFSLPQ